MHLKRRGARAPTPKAVFHIERTIIFHFLIFCLMAGPFGLEYDVLMDTAFSFLKPLLTRMV